MAWLVVHLIGLIGFRNRLIVLINWAWDYFFYDRAVKLISRDTWQNIFRPAFGGEGKTVSS